jgi:hypothetical protein
LSFAAAADHLEASNILVEIVETVLMTGKILPFLTFQCRVSFPFFPLAARRHEVTKPWFEYSLDEISLPTQTTMKTYPSMASSNRTNVGEIGISFQIRHSQNPNRFWPNQKDPNPTTLSAVVTISRWTEFGVTIVGRPDEGKNLAVPTHKHPCVAIVSVSTEYAVDCSTD